MKILKICAAVKICRFANDSFMAMQLRVEFREFIALFVIYVCASGLSSRMGNSENFAILELNPE